MNMKLKDLRMAKGISQEKLAQYCSVSRSTVAMWEINKAQPDIETLKKLAEYFETSIDYLIGRTDYTDLENETICKNLQKHLTPNYTGFKIDGRKYIIPDEMMDSIFNSTYKFTKYDLQLILDSLNLTEEECLAPIASSNTIFLDDTKIHMIPLYESVSAGFGAYAANEIIGYMPCFLPSDAEASETLYIKVSGDSMYPKIENGDIVQVHKQSSVDSGSIAVVLLDKTEGLVKKVVYGEDWIELHSINPMYPVQRFSGEQITRLEILGLVKRITKDV